MKADAVFESITAKLVRIIEAGEHGTWERPWAALAGQGLPINATTRTAYQGGNIIALWIEELENGYPTNEWATYKQWAGIDAQVRKGEKGTHLIRWVSVKCKDHGPEERCTKCGRVVPTGFVVFNAAQVDGYTPEPLKERTPLERIEEAERFFAAVGADVRYGGDRAFYARVQDYIQVPEPDTFHTPEGFYSTLAHEHVHWTGHEDRLNRTFGARFGDDTYAAEELVAELGSAFLCAALGIEDSPREDHAAYLGHWVSILRAEPRVLFDAASRASKAVSFLQEAAKDRELVPA